MEKQRSIDELVPRELSAQAKLVNIRAASIVDLFNTPAVYLPVAVSDSPAGRETVYKLPIGEQTLMGIYVLKTSLFLDYYTRLSETEYAVRKESSTGNVVFSGTGKLEILDDRVGAGELVVTSEEEPTAAAPVKKCVCTRRWYV